LYQSLKDDTKKIELLLYCDTEITDMQQENVKIVCTPNTTKYNRILMALSDTKSGYILFVDNDITPDTGNINVFLEESIIERADIAWGTIGISYKKTFVSRLVLIDKLLSHKIIRPLLWKLNIGISIPGQVFLIDRAKFQCSLPEYDTVFDDLTVGICAKQNKLNYFYSQLCLGYEKPSSSLLILAKQRIRWAKGFYQSIVLNVGNKSMLPFVFIHGIAYHIMLFVFWSILYQIFSKSYWLYAMTLWLVFCFFIADKKVKNILYASIYTIVFPFIHLIWFISLLYYSVTNIFTKNR
jgi:cellulose synthase/poly-beta-1,6-N-acetylglucosamine synthase-like glycosyltransferase